MFGTKRLNAFRASLRRATTAGQWDCEREICKVKAKYAAAAGNRADLAMVEALEKCCRRITNEAVELASERARNFRIKPRILAQELRLHLPEVIAELRNASQLEWRSPAFCRNTPNPEILRRLSALEPDMLAAVDDFELGGMRSAAEGPPPTGWQRLWKIFKYAGASLLAWLRGGH